MIVYGVMRATQLIYLYEDDADARAQMEIVNATFKRGVRATVVPMNVIPRRKS